MPVFNITVVNQTFESCNDHDLPSIDEARDEAIRSAFQIGLAEVGVAHPLFAAEVKIACDGEQLGRYIISLGVSPLRES